MGVRSLRPFGYHIKVLILGLHTAGSAQCANSPACPAKDSEFYPGHQGHWPAVASAPDKVSAVSASHLWLPPGLGGGGQAGPHMLTSLPLCINEISDKQGLKCT